MKLAISSHDGKLDTPFSTRFGRCEYFIFIDTETRNWEAVANPASAASNGAGSQVVQFLAAQQVEVTITGHYGPSAFKAIEAAGIRGYEAASGTPEELLEKYLAGELKRASEAGPSRRH